MEIAVSVFGDGVRLVASDKSGSFVGDGDDVAVFGHGWGKELRLPRRGKVGAYFVDWILAHIGPDKRLKEFVAVEVQTIDTTGNYQAEREAYLGGVPFDGRSTAGFNWENVNKRILPQLIYKGNVLRRERLCKQGLFFVCPGSVYEKIIERLGNSIEIHPKQTGALTFRKYGLGTATSGLLRPLVFEGEFTSTIDQVAWAFVSPSNLPPQGVYEDAIVAKLQADV